MTKLLVATRSAHKLQEIREILRDSWAGELVDLNTAGIPEGPDEDSIEIFGSFAENAMAKARYFGRLADLAVIADDSGLCVDALGGAPGVHSKRFAPSVAGIETDQANNVHLLHLLNGVPPRARTARYICVIALATPERGEQLFEGSCEGEILTMPRGTGGFGYDPLFLPAGSDRSFGELSQRRKNLISHRAQALKAAADHLWGPSRIV
ncbi:XTP/dITP diphosphatase [soil metagenome]